MTPRAIASFDIEFSIVDESKFSSEPLLLLEDAVTATERLWEAALLGHQHHTESVIFPIEIGTFDDGLAWGNYDESIQAGDFVLPKNGGVFINPRLIPGAANGFGIVPGMNLVDDAIALEVGHVLGIGTLWQENGVYVKGSGQYTGSHGLQAYREEFDQDAAFVPVELGGGERTADAHWDQIVRTSAEEGDPDSPLALSPLLVVVDGQGRDFAMEQMTSVLNPDYGEPILSNTTVQSLFSSADLIVTVAAGGYEVGPRAAAASVPGPTAVLLATIGCIAVFSIRQRWCSRRRGRHMSAPTFWHHDLGTTKLTHFTRANPMSNVDPPKQPPSEDGARTSETSLGFLQALQQGDRHATAWRYLVETYGPFLRAILARKGLRAQAADDVVQNVLLVIVRRLPEFERQRTGSFRTWLRSITVNCLRDYWRTEGKPCPGAGNCKVQSLIEELQDAHSELSQIWNREHAHHVVGLLLEAVRKDFEPKTIEVFKQLALLKAPVDDVARRFEITPNACFIARSRVMKRLKVLSRDLFGRDDSLDGLAR